MYHIRRKTNAYLLLPDPHFCNNPFLPSEMIFRTEIFFVLSLIEQCAAHHHNNTYTSFCPIVIHSFNSDTHTAQKWWYWWKNLPFLIKKGLWPLKDVTIYHWIFYILWWPFLQGLLKFAYEFKLLKSAFPSISAFFGRVLKKQRKLRWWSAMWAFYSEFMIIVLVCISIKSMMHQFIKIKKPNVFHFLVHPCCWQKRKKIRYSMSKNVLRYVPKSWHIVTRRCFLVRRRQIDGISCFHFNCGHFLTIVCWTLIIRWRRSSNCEFSIEISSEDKK